jgi:ubiquinone/menaquinone biosynthesis C-methylase UbiE
MLLNRIEYALVNNPVRAYVQRAFEVRRLVRMGGKMKGGAALEIGCGRGVGVELILDVFEADSVDAFDLDPRMIARARRRLKHRAERVRLWAGDACAIAAPDARYDAVFDFAAIHHVPDWRRALAEVYRLLKPGGRFYAEEVFRSFIGHPLWRRLLEHPQEDRFDHDLFRAALVEHGLEPVSSNELWHGFGWFVADKPVG